MVSMQDVWCNRYGLPIIVVLIYLSLTSFCFNEFLKVERIQNKTLYQQYLAKKKQMDDTNPPGHQNEQKLWHGTDKDAEDSITKYGFNRSYCGKHGMKVKFLV